MPQVTRIPPSNDVIIRITDQEAAIITSQWASAVGSGSPYRGIMFALREGIKSSKVADPPPALVEPAPPSVPTLIKPNWEDSGVIKMPNGNAIEKRQLHNLDGHIYLPSSYDWAIRRDDIGIAVLVAYEQGK